METINYKGKELKLTQDAYRSGTFDKGMYRAHAIDSDENCYRITWEIINEETENEDEACDWNSFEVEAL